MDLISFSDIPSSDKPLMAVTSSLKREYNEIESNNRL